MCFHFFLCVSGTSDTSCSCGGLYEEIQKTIVSFPVSYSTRSPGCNLNCFNTIKAPAGSMISLTTNYFEVHPYYDTVKVLEAVEF